MRIANSFPQATLWADRTTFAIEHVAWCTKCHNPCFEVRATAMLEEHSRQLKEFVGPFRHLTLPEAYSILLGVIGSAAAGVDAILTAEALVLAGQEELELGLD